jgi:hypothetical protein
MRHRCIDVIRKTNFMEEHFEKKLGMEQFAEWSYSILEDYYF